MICGGGAKPKEHIVIEDIKKLTEEDVVIIGFDEDWLARKAVSECIKYKIKYYAGVRPDLNNKLTSYCNIDEDAWNTANVLAQINGKYFQILDFETIFQAIKQTRKLNGAFVEIGTYRGDSAEAALEYMKNSQIIKESYFLDTYEGFTYESAVKSSDALWAGSHVDTSIELVRRRLQRYSHAHCIKCNIIEEDLPSEIEQIAVCNIDVDMYEAVYAALKKVRSSIMQGGMILAEDYGHTPNLIGAQYAVERFLSECEDEFIAVYTKGSQMLLIKK